MDEKKEKSKSKEKLKDKIDRYKKKLKDKWPEIKKRAMGPDGIIYGSVFVAVLFIILITVQSCTPKRGTILYGLCRSFLELQVTYPETIQHSAVEQYRKALRIYFTHTDAFGEYQLEMIECSFVQDPTRGVLLEKAYFDHIKSVTSKVRAPGKGRLYEVEPQYIELFNRSLSPAAIVSQEPDLILPTETFRF